MFRQVRSSSIWVYIRIPKRIPIYVSLGSIDVQDLGTERISSGPEDSGKLRGLKRTGANGVLREI